MVYSVKEIFMTLQGEGYHAGRAAVFLRFSGCNLWNGLEKDREFAVCQFCDTDFVGINGVNGGKFPTAQELVNAVVSEWTGGEKNRFIVITGGEPLLQLDKDLINALHAESFMIAVETNGTLLPPNGIDWVCMSPKAGSDLKIFTGDELKLVYPQDNYPPEIFENLRFKHFYLQPKDDENKDYNTQLCVDYCKKNPHWRLSVQTHKLINIP